jgi:plastocyanin
MIRKVLLIIASVGLLLATNSHRVVAADIRVTVDSQVMAPGMTLKPAKVELHLGDTVTWVNMTGRGIKMIPDWEEAAPLPSYIRSGGTVQLKFDRPGTYRYAVFTATDRFEQDWVPVKISGVVVVDQQAPRP